MGQPNLHTFEVSGKKYSADKLDAMKQFHIVRKLGPIIAGLLPAGVAMKDMSAFLEKETASVLPGIAEALARLKDEDADFILYGLLSVVKQEQPNGLGWAPVSSGNQMMYQNISMPDMLKIAFQSGQHNFRDFFSALPQPSTGAN